MLPMIGSLRWLTSAATGFGIGSVVVLLVRHRLSHDRIQGDELLLDELSAGEPAATIERHLVRQRAWLALRWYQQVFTPVPISWRQHYTHTKGAYTGGD